MEIVRDIFICAAALTVLLAIFEKYRGRQRSEPGQPESRKPEHPWHPIRLNTNVHGNPVTHSCGAPSSARLRANYTGPEPDSDPRGYVVEFYDSETGETMPFDPSRQDHQDLYEHFLIKIHDFAREFIAPGIWPKKPGVAQSEDQL